MDVVDLLTELVEMNFQVSFQWIHFEVFKRSRLDHRLGKREYVFPMVIWPAFRIGQYRANDHPYHAPRLIRAQF